MKVAGHELKGLISYFNLSLKEVHFPIMSLVDYLGFRVIAMSLLPISKDSLVYGTGDAARTIHSDSGTSWHTTVCVCVCVRVCVLHV
jgi:Clustered mitochondria